MPDFTCKHFKQCGGCALLDLPYEQQVAQKTARVQTLLAPFWNGPLPATVTDHPLYFRNKVEVGFCHQPVWKEPFDKKVKRDKTQPLEFEQCLGFKLKGRWDRAVDIVQCITFDEHLVPLLEAVRAWAKQENLEYYDHRKHTGILRHLMLRVGKNTGQAMVVLFVTDEVPEKSFVQTVEKVWPEANILLAVNTSLADTAVPELLRVLKGKDHICEKIILTNPDGNKEKGASSMNGAACGRRPVIRTEPTGRNKSVFMLHTRMKTRYD